MTESLPPALQFFIPQNSTIIVGLSGGPDSICLLHILHSLKNEYNLHLIAAHLDHEWQESSKIAVKLCRDTCNSLDISLIVKKLSELKFEVKWNGSQEELGRKMRRHFFESVAYKYQANFIALAHHQQDQHETFFIRLLRGSSLAGLVGIKKHDGLYIRPLLDWSKQEILDYLYSHNLKFYTDPTNISDEYLRNRIRNNLIPTIKNIDARFESSLTSTMQQLYLAHDFIHQQTLLTLQSIQTDQGLNITHFLALHSVLQYNLLLKLMIEQNVSSTPSQKLFKEIMRFLEKSTKNKHILHETWMIKKNTKFFSLIKFIKNDKNL